MSSTTTRFWGFLLGLAVAFTVGIIAVFAGTASAGLGSEVSQNRVVLYEDATMTITQDGDWTRWESNKELNSETTRVYRGERNETGGCDFNVVDAGRDQAPEGFVYLEREVAQNLASCVSITQTALVRSDEANDTAATEEFSEYIPGGRIGKVAPQASGTKTVWLKVVYEDPVFIDVTSVKSQVTFSYNGSCVTGSSGHNGYWGWFPGWTKTSSGGSAAQNCSYAATQSYGHYKNDVFCQGAGNTTYNDYDNVTVYGEENGTQTNSYNTSKSGGCAYLLHRSVLSS